MLPLIVALCLFSLAGIIVGMFTGVTPGLHLNLVSVAAVGILPALSLPLFLVFCFVISMAVTHTIVDVLASTYLGVPDENTVAGLLPAQQMVLDGRAHESVFFTILGSVFGVFVTVPLLFCLFWYLEFLQNILAPLLGVLLLVIIGYLLFREDERLLCVCIFLISGGFGTIVLSLSWMSQPLLPLLGGLYGGVGLVEIIMKNIQIPRQNSSRAAGPLSLLAVIGASITGIVAAFLPGIGSSQAAILAGRFFRTKNVHAQLTLVGGINTVNMVFSLATWIALDKSRNGAIAALASLGTTSFSIMIALILVCCIAATVAGGVAILVSRRVCLLFERVNYRVLASVILAFVLGLVWFFDGYVGIIIFLCATCLGMLCHTMGAPKHYLMGCLLCQVLVFFLQ